MAFCLVVRMNCTGSTESPKLDFTQLYLTKELSPIREVVYFKLYNASYFASIRHSYH